MNSEMLDFLFALVFSSVFLISMLVLTFVLLKSFILYKINKKSIENSKFLLNDGWSAITVNVNGIPVLLKKDKKIISLSEIKSIKAKCNARI